MTTSLSAGVLDPQGPVAASQHLMLWNATVIMAAVIVPVMVLTVAVAWWFRASNRRARRRPDWAYSGSLEVVVWSVPLLVILFLGGIAWIGSHALDPRRPLASQQAPLDIEVVSLDWKWLFIQPRSGVASVNHLVVPVGRPLRLHLTSTTVMNSFLVPQLGSQIYTMAGMTTELNLQADRPGVYPGLSAQFSGDGFSDMRFEVEAVSPRDFEAWLAAAASEGAVLDADALRELERPGTTGRARYRVALPDLFATLVRRQGHGATPGMAGMAGMADAPVCRSPVPPAIPSTPSTRAPSP
jgi:cytochrome o ubiquinol oxidase subunit 2